MTFRALLSAAEPLRHEDPGAGIPDELAEAERLIADLAALVDAGLVVVEDHVLGPARYDVAVLHRASPRTRMPRTAHSPSFSGETRPGLSVGSPP